jgi:phytoene synthase
MPPQNSALSYCADQVRRYDNDRFLTALFAPADRREDLLALYAFNMEVAKSREAVREPTLGRIRLQWWREAIDELYDGRPRAHEVLRPLAEAVVRHGLERTLFDALIDAREADMDDEPPASETALEAYAEATSVPLVRLALQVLGAAGSEAAQTAARGVGVAWSLAGLLRATRFLAAVHRRMLPDALLAQHGVNEVSLFDLKPSPALSAAARDVAARAGAHLAEARARRRQVPAAAVPALLPGTLAGLTLATLRRAGHDPLAPALALGHPWRHLALAWNAARRRY